jgi:hypothetical protein
MLGVGNASFQHVLQTSRARHLGDMAYGSYAAATLAIARPERPLPGPAFAEAEQWGAGSNALGREP